LYNKSFTYKELEQLKAEDAKYIKELTKEIQSWEKKATKAALEGNITKKQFALEYIKAMKEYLKRLEKEFKDDYRNEANISLFRKYL
jgi:hypothetical protein